MLLVDDQSISRTGMIRMIEWERHGLELAGQCSNGAKALEFMQEHDDIDIVITDVRMPVMDGLTFIERARELFPATAYIVISGYDDFDYVRRSLKLKVVDYLLKPVDYEELNQMLGRLIDNTKQLREEAAAERRRTRERFFALLYEEAFGSEEEVLTAWGDMEDNDLSQRIFGTALWIGDLSRPHEEFRSWLEQQLNTGAVVDLCRKKEGCLIVLQGLRAEVEGALSTLRSLRSAEGGAAIVLNPCDSIFELQDAFAQLERSGVLNQIDPTHEHRLEEQTLLALDSLGTWEKEWVSLLRKGQLAEANGKLNGWIAEEPQPHLPVICSYLLLRGARALLDNRHIAPDEFGLAVEQANRVAEASPADSLALLSAYFRGRELAKPTHGMEIKQSIEKAKAYIEAHFDEGVNLSELAQTYYMSPGYFSSMFRQHTGRNFLEYLTQLRMAHAQKRLSEQPSIRISDLAAECGYADIKHFRKLFKRYYGKTPLQFREQLDGA